MNASLQHGTVPAVEQETADRLAIRDLVENWAVWRDARTGSGSAPCGTSRAG